MKFKCIIVDDEPPATRILENYISKVSFLEQVGVFNDSLKALEFLNTQKVDVIFLDIQMPENDGVSFYGFFQIYDRVGTQTFIFSKNA